MKHCMVFIALLFTILIPSFANAELRVDMRLTSNNQSIGSVIIKEAKKGVTFIPDLHGLPPGKHGFHIHANASCDNHGDAAGGHLDPEKTGKHLGPYRNGHLGDLPVLEVANDGSATTPVTAPRLKMSDVYKHSLMIHAGGDNYSDFPEKLGGGGKRLACGVIKLQ